jgi:hypothetical protein
LTRRSALALAVVAALLAGCSSGAPAVEDGAAPGGDGGSGATSSAWVEVAATQFQANGESGGVEISARQPLAALAVRATTAPGVCFQLSAVVDGEGRTVIDGRSAGSFCRTCSLRASVAVEAGVFVLPVEPGRFQPETGLSLRFARVDCLTLTPLLAPADLPALRVAAQPIEEVPEQAALDLRFHIAKSSILSGDEARQKALLAALGEELASAGVTPRLLEARELDVPPEDIHFQAGEHASLAALKAASPGRDEATLDIYFGGCLLLDNPLFGPPGAVNGFTPSIPGGAGPADGVFLPGLDCFAKAAGPDDVPVRAQARVLAHEIGHYLGLYHTVEADGLADQLDDTGPENIMNPNPGLASSVGFSPSQGRAMRMHPSVHSL